jgi:virulence factor
MDRTNRLRAAIIGAGKMANMVHYPSLASFEDVEIAAICDRASDRLNDTADKYGVAARYRDYQSMVEEVRPDAVYAIGDPDVMYPVWIWCLRRGLNLFVEKPLGLTLHQARALAYLAEQNGCITQVGFQRRASPLLTHLRAACLERGPITHAVCQFYKYAPEPFLGARDHMMDDGVHAIDTLRWLCGGEITEIQSIARSVGTPDINFLAATLSFDNGATGMLMNSWTSGRRIFRVEMHAPGICAEADPEGEGRLFAEGELQGEVFTTQAVARSDSLFGFGGFRDKSREFLDCVRSGSQPGSHFGDAVKTMEAAERILAQALLREAYQ